MSAKTTIWILGDQLRTDISSLAGLTPADCRIFMAESLSRARVLPFHKQKITFIWSAMRHFAAELGEHGFEVDYYETHSNYREALEKHLRRTRAKEIRLMETAEHGRSDALRGMASSLGARIDVTPNNLFLSDKAAFADWASGRKKLVLDTFYRDMRRKTGLLMDGNEPVGGAWNYDRENRRTPPADHSFPDLPRFEPDEITRRVMRWVERSLPDHFGEIGDFALPVTRADAESHARDFLDNRLDLFGPYQDAIVAGQHSLYHSQLSPLINVGLLEPLELCRAAETKYRTGKARLASVEGFIRQILGWREFIYNVYHLEMPDYLESNALEADIPLPSFYWDGDTDMHCVADAVTLLRRHASNHHIQRLMITGNFALLAGIDPRQVNDWYLLAFVDAYEWVVTPNVLGMALYADGGRFATKPYAASANYINKMSNCCKGCAYDPKTADREDSCPFNSLYWDFLDRNANRIGRNPRMSMLQRTWQKRPAATRKAILARAASLRDRLRSNRRV